MKVAGCLGHLPALIDNPGHCSKIILTLALQRSWHVTTVKGRLQGQAPLPLPPPQLEPPALPPQTWGMEPYLTIFIV